MDFEKYRKIKIIFIKFVYKYSSKVTLKIIFLQESCNLYGLFIDSDHTMFLLAT